MSVASRRRSALSWAVLSLLLLGLWRCTTLGSRTTPGLEACGGEGCTAGTVLDPAPGAPLLLLVSARLDGVPARLLLDTGTAATVLDAGWAERQGGLARARSVVGALNESFGLQPLVPVHRLEAAGAVFTAFEAAAVDLAPVSGALGVEVAGILGWNVLGRSAVEIDFGARRLSVDPAPGGAIARAVAAAAAPFELRVLGGGPFAEVAVGEASGRFLLDSGAAPTRIESSLAEQGGATDSRQAVRAVRDVMGSVRAAVTSVSLPRLGVGAVLRSGLRADLASANLLGADFFAGTVLRFDPASGRASLEPSRPVATAP